MTLKEWKMKCASWARKLAGIDDLLDEDDPYDVFDEMEDYYEADTHPKVFVLERFADEVEAQGGYSDDSEEDEDSDEEDIDDDDSEFEDDD